jgi:hypothetical protein
MEDNEENDARKLFAKSFLPNFQKPLWAKVFKVKSFRSKNEFFFGLQLIKKKAKVSKRN